MDHPQKDTGLRDTFRTIGGLGTVGLSFVFAIFIGAGLGYYLMTRFGFGSWIFFLGFALGVAAGVLNVYRTAKRFIKQVAADPLVGRIIRMAAVICAAAAAIAWGGWGAPMALGVLGGGLLLAISLYTIGGGVSAIVAAASGQPGGRPNLGVTLVKVVLRYALLGFLAYVMIARLRLHPLGLLVGATSITAAAFVEAVRLHTKRS